MHWFVVARRGERAAVGAEITSIRPARHAFIAARFPTCAPSGLERLGQGWDNAAYLVDATAVFRFPQRAVAAPLVETEIAVLPAIAQPYRSRSRFRAGSASRRDVPWRFAGYPLGSPLDTATPAAAARHALAQPLAGYPRSCARCTRSILHALAAAGLPPDTIGRALEADSASARAGGRGARRRAARARRGGAGAHLRRGAPSGEPERLVVVHGDLYARHLLLDDGRRRCAGGHRRGSRRLGRPAVELSVARSAAGKLRNVNARTGVRRVSSTATARAGRPDRLESRPSRDAGRLDDVRGRRRSAGTAR